MISKHVDLIIFDLDGTLVDSGKDIVSSVNFTLKNIGLKEKSGEEVLSYVGTGVEDLIKKSLGKDGIGIFEKALSIFESHHTKHANDTTLLYPGVRETLEYFKPKKKAIVTNRKLKYALVTLKRLGIDKYFEHIEGADDILCRKPFSCPLDKIISMFNINKNSCIIVGDMDIDILSGKNAGIRTCGVTYGIGKKQDIIKAGPDFIIDNMLELKDLIA